MTSTIKQRLRRFNGTDYDMIHLETDSDSVICPLDPEPLNTSTLTNGQTGVYFKDYPDITWQVQHIDGDYAYLALYPMTETCTFGPNSTYSGSTVATKCDTYLSDTIPNVTRYLSDVTVNGVTAKVFIPSKAMLDTDWDWPKASASNRICQLDGTNKAYWTSTSYNATIAYILYNTGNFITQYATTITTGFRPAVKVKYRNNTLQDSLTERLDSLKEAISEAASSGTGPTVIATGDINVQSSSGTVQYKVADLPNINSNYHVKYTNIVGTYNSTTTTMPNVVQAAGPSGSYIAVGGDGNSATAHMYLGNSSYPKQLYLSCSPSTIRTIRFRYTIYDGYVGVE